VKKIGNSETGSKLVGNYFVSIEDGNLTGCGIVESEEGSQLVSRSDFSAM